MGKNSYGGVGAQIRETKGALPCWICATSAPVQWLIVGWVIVQTESVWHALIVFYPRICWCPLEGWQSASHHVLRKVRKNGSVHPFRI
jgi:hypothetical protein